MSNAIKFSAPHSTITVTLRESHIGSPGMAEAVTTAEGGDDLTLEETVLLQESNIGASAESPCQAITSSKSPRKEEELSMRGGGGARSANSFDGVEGEARKADMWHGEAEDDFITVNGKKCEKFGLIIVSFVDSGVGVSKVCRVVTITTRDFTFFHCRRIRNSFSRKLCSSSRMSFRMVCKSTSAISYSPSNFCVSSVCLTMLWKRT